jgi:hypothetical protein
MDLNLATWFSVAPSVVSELSSFGTLSDVENETEAVANGGSAETGVRGVTRHPLFWFENDIVNVQVRLHIQRSVRAVLIYLILRLRTSRSRSTPTFSLAIPTKEGLS